ncbi:hypothetical protein HanIR_Chr06g0296991 [Helianthus annuus]|nr:hypothetical protein HanIR_Chr06g0296991 [Helianthus annuus]
MKNRSCEIHLSVCEKFHQVRKSINFIPSSNIFPSRVILVSEVKILFFESLILVRCSFVY